MSEDPADERPNHLKLCTVHVIREPIDTCLTEEVKRLPIAGDVVFDMPMEGVNPLKTWLQKNENTMMTSNPYAEVSICQDTEGSVNDTMHHADIIEYKKDGTSSHESGLENTLTVGHLHQSPPENAEYLGSICVRVVTDKY